MTNPGKINAEVSIQNGIYIATTPQFPTAKGTGASVETALNDLRSKLEEYVVPVGPLKNHPLYSTILEWFHSTTGPTFPFLPEAEFEADLKSRNLGDTCTRQIIQTYNETAILGCALVAGEYNEGIHEALYIAAGHPLGFSLAHAAGLAFRLPDYFPAFCASTHKPGLVRALTAWAEENELTKSLDGKSELGWVNRNLVTPDHPAGEFWQNVCRTSFEKFSEFNEALTREVVAAKAAKRTEKKRRERGIQEKKSDFIQDIKILWVPAALWCMSDSQIVATLAPRLKDNMSEAYEKVRRNISTLGFTKSRQRNA